MNYSIAIIDGLYILAAAAAFFVIISSRKKKLQLDIRLILSALVLVNILYGTCLFLEWAGVSTFPETYENLIGATVPMMWAILFYSLLQNVAGNDLKKSEERFRKLFEGSNDLIIVHKFGRIIDVNKKACEVLGYSREQFLNMSIPDLHTVDEREYGRERVEKLDEYSDKIFQASLLKANGEIIHVEVSTSIIDRKNGVGQGMLRDITQRKKSEKLLRESEERYRLLAEYANDVIFTLDLDLKYTYVSPSFKRLRGFSPEEITGKGINTILTPRSQDAVRKLFEESWHLMQKKGRFEHESIKLDLETYDKDGNVIWCEIVLSFIYGKDNKPLSILGVSRDISERKQAEEELRRSEEKFSKAFHLSPDSITISLLRTGRFVEINRGFERIFGITRGEAMGLSALEVGIWRTKEDRKKMVRELLKSGRIRDMEVEMQTKSGVPLICLLSGELMDIHNEKYVLAIIRDVTDKRKAESEKIILEEQLRQTQKMQAIGTLAGGIAHDFNNILSIIFGFTELARMDIDSPEKIEKNLCELNKASLRAKDLIAQILTVSRQTEHEKHPLQISTIVGEALKLLRSTIPSSIEIRHDFSSQGTVMADATQIHQIIMNLCTNAYHAMDEKGGILGVTIDDTDVLNDDIVVGSTVAPGKYVRIVVSDTGHGMDEKTKERIFEPYYTTKKQGEGTGLGLAVVHGIVESHEGVINVYSEPGKGTSFHIYLPLFEGAAVSITNQAETEGSLEGRERILFVDDEKIITDIAYKMLSRFGYEVSVFHESTEAFEEFKNNTSKYDLVITDMTMPSMNGITLSKKIFEIKPDMPVILCSGYNRLIDQQILRDMNISFVSKPIIMNELIKTVRNIFNDEKDD